MAASSYATWLRFGEWPESYTPFVLPPETYRWPIYVLGLAGTGKSTLLANLALRLHALGEGVLLIDTKDGDLADAVAQRTPPDSLVYIAPGRCYFEGHPHHWSMNPLGVKDRSRLGFSRVHSNVMAMFERMERADYSVMTQVRYNLDMTLRLALYHQYPTMLTVRRLLTDPDFRQQLLADPNLSDEVRSHWRRFDARSASEQRRVVESTLPRIQELLADPQLYYLVSQPRSTVDLPGWLDAGKLVVANLAAGMSETNALFLGNLFMALFTNAVFARQEAGQSRRWRLVSDEFDRLAGRNFAELIDKARSYRAFPIMSHQNIDQLKSGGRGEVFNAASSAPVVINFRTSKQDEATMRRWVKDEQLSQQLTFLRRFQATVTLFDGIEGLVDPGQSVRVLLDPLQGEDSPAALEAAILSQRAHTTRSGRCGVGGRMGMSRRVRPRRQGRIHFKPVANPYPIEMVEKPYQTMQFLNLFGGLTSWQVCKLLFLNQPNPQGAERGEVAARKAANHKCLRRLKDLGYVATRPIVQADNPLAKWEINHLTDAGYEALTDYYAGHGRRTLPYRSPSALTNQTWTPHHMGIVEVGIAAYAGAPAQGVQVEVWQDDLGIRALSKSGSLSWPMEPDALLVIARKTWRQPFFVEVDRHSESVASPRANSWATKMAKYHRYFVDEHRHDRWLKDLPRPQLLVVCQTTRRLRGLMEAAAAGGTSGYWFTVADHLEPPDGFFAEIWQRSGRDGYHSPAECFPS